MSSFGARFSLYPMTDRYIEIILGALEKTDTSAVYSFTDAVSTVYRGPAESVLDALRGLFTNAYDESVHMAMEGDIYPFVPEDIEIPQSFISEPNTLVTADFPVKCKLALAIPDRTVDEGLEYITSFHSDMDLIFSGLSVERIPYGVKIEGYVSELFSFLRLLLERTQTDGISAVLHFTVNCNSPTAE